VGLGHHKIGSNRSKTHALANPNSKLHTNPRGSVRIPFKPTCKFLRDFFCDDRSGVDISPPSGESWHSRFTIPAQGSSTIMHWQFSRVKSMWTILTRTQPNVIRTGAWCPSTPPYPRPSSPLPPHPVLRLLLRPRRQKLLHHRRMTILRSIVQRRLSILRRVAAVRQAPPLSSQVRAAPPARVLAEESHRWIGRGVLYNSTPPTPPKSAAASLHSAARGSGQAGTPSLRASACAPSRSYGPLGTTPPQYQPV